MESKFLDQDVDVVSLANKGIVIGCFVGRNYNKILLDTAKFVFDHRCKSLIMINLHAENTKIISDATFARLFQ